MRWALLPLLILAACQKPTPLATAQDPCNATPVFRMRVPKVRPAEGRRLLNMTRDMLVLMVTAFVDPAVSEVRYVSAPNSTTDEWLEADCRAVFPDARPMFAQAGRQRTYLEVFQSIRNDLKAGHYHRSSAYRHSGSAMPVTLAEFQARHPYRSWSYRRVVPESRAKGKRRVIYRSPLGSSAAVSVAETYEGDANSAIRETEILITRDDGSGNSDFYAYDAEGNLTDSSLFLSSGGIERKGFLPHTCLTCHYDENRRTFQRLPLTHRPN